MACCTFPLAVLSVLLLALLRHVTASFPLLCGQELVKAVAAVCDDRGYYGQPSKRSAGIFELETRAKAFLKSSSSTGELRRSKRRIRTGLIVTECCLNRCSVTHLESYCNPLPEDAVHDSSVHIRLEKSAEEDIDETTGRPQDGPSQLDPATGVVSGTDTSATRGRTRVDIVEEVLSNRFIPTSTTGSSPTPPRKKPRKDKSERRNSSREAKQARREERRRNRERSSGGKSRSGRRKNKDNGRSSRGKRHDLDLWTNMFSDKNSGMIHAPESQRTFDVANRRAPSTYNVNTFEMKTSVPDLAHSTDDTVNGPRPADEEKQMQFSALMKKLRTLVLNSSHGR